jgi:hypothetical protein
MAEYAAEAKMVGLSQIQPAQNAPTADIEPDTDTKFTALKFAKWLSAVDKNPASWREDERYRKTENGVMFYIGGESGQYMHIEPDGKLTAAKYEHAPKDIESATLHFGDGCACHKFPNYEQALMLAMTLGGDKLKANLFGDVGRLAALVDERRGGIAGHAQDHAKPEAERGDGYTSVLAAIEKGKTAPKPPRKTKTPAKGKGKDGEEI